MLMCMSGHAASLGTPGTPATPVSGEASSYTTKAHHYIIHYGVGELTLELVGTPGRAGRFTMLCASASLLDGNWGEHLGSPFRVCLGDGST